MINKKINNQKILIITILLTFIFIININPALCEDITSVKTSTNMEDTYNYKKIFFYTLSFITIGILLYYTFSNNNGPDNFNIDSSTIMYKKGVLGISTEPLSETQKEIINNLTLKDTYLNRGFDRANAYLAELTDKIMLNYEVYDMNIPTFHMSNFKINTFYGVTNANLTELYSLPSNSLIAFNYFQNTNFYQIITAGELIELITKYNIVL